MSNRNDNPERYAASESPAQDCPIVSIEGNTVIFEQSVSHSHGTPVYLGCIVSADRSQVLWTNYSEPLPVSE